MQLYIAICTTGNETRYVDIFYFYSMPLSTFRIGSKPLVDDGFTVVYPYISKKHYKDEVPISKEQTAPETEPTPTSKPSSMPGFSVVTAITALALPFFRFSRH